MKNVRIEWVDSLKFLGIFAIFLGHFGQQAGHAYEFVFRYHVALFFFVSGFFTAKNINSNTSDFIIKKTKQILIPYYIYALTFLIVVSISGNWSIERVQSSLWYLAAGIRNHPVVGSLWFLNCIYVTIIIDFIAIKILKKNSSTLLISFLAFLYTQTLMPHNPRVEPSWFWNVDSALSYWFFMALGRSMFDMINNSDLFNPGSFRSYPLIAISIFVAVLFFFCGPNILIDLGRETLTEKNKTVWMSFFILQSMFSTLTLIIFNVFIAKCISKHSTLRKVGENTLHLCGLENTTKLILPSLLTSVGLVVTLSTPLATYFYALMCLAMAYLIACILKKTIPFLK